MRQITEVVREALEPLLAERAGSLCVALSGGLDSTVLTHVLAHLALAPLRAVYINHQLHPEAAAWGAQCEQFCKSLGVPLTRLTVSVRAAGEGLEAAARRARYAALAGALAADEILLTAHHQDDQAETVLLHLLRGAGAAGLSGIPPRGALGAARLSRPLLEIPRAALAAYARQHGLTFIEDPSNADRQLDRNFLRHEILPLLESRWPGLRGTLGRGARLSGETAALLLTLADQDARRVVRRGRISLAALADLAAGDEGRARNLLRHLCRRELGSAPAEAPLREGLAQLLHAGVDRQPLLAWAGGEIRRYRDVLYLLPPSTAEQPAPQELESRSGARLELGGGLGRLRLTSARGAGLAPSVLAPSLQVRYRAGGERFRPAGEPHSRELKKLLQRRGVVPWMRERLPLLYSGTELVAVADVWMAQPFAAAAGAPGLRVRWDGHPPLD